MNTTDTIAAIATAMGESAIGIVRVSGPEAVSIVNRIFEGRDLEAATTHTMHYGHIVDSQTREWLDEVMVSVMRAPRSYTTEDSVEVNTHGGIVAMQRILEHILRQGARLAEPGEFTQRAFLNGRIDLSQAEAVMDLIQAKSTKAMDASLNQLGGSLSRKIRQLRQEMLQTLARVEVTIDYPEYDGVEEMGLQELGQTAASVRQQIQQILAQAQRSTLFRNGIHTAIIGRPNVGKSSLMNALTGLDKAIVTDIEGTTRDTIEEFINIRGVPLHLIDTAGIRQTDEVVEKIGVEKSRQVMAQADLIILIINQSQPLQAMDYELLELTRHQNRLILLNKEDLAPVITAKDLGEDVAPDDVISTSMMTEAGLDQLEAQIEARFFSGNLSGTDTHYLLNTRHTDLLHQAVDALDEVLMACEMAVPVDLIQIDYTRAWDLLGEITGERVQDELLDKLFSQFCLGK